MKTILKTLIVATTFVGSTASAATFDFLSVGSGALLTDTIAFDEGTFVSSGGGLFVGAGGEPNSICATGPSCAHDLTLTFNGLASAISFDVVGAASPGSVTLDSVTVSLFGDSGFLESQTIGSNGTFSFSSVDVTSILFDDMSPTGGVGYANFNFDFIATEASPVPLPAGGLLLLSGFAGVSVLKRRKKKIA